MATKKIHARHVAALREAHLAGKRLLPAEVEALLNTAEYWVAEGERRERERSEQAIQSLHNVKGLALRMRRHEHMRDLADHFLRFCREAGVEPTILRGDHTASAKEEP